MRIVKFGDCLSGQAVAGVIGIPGDSACIRDGIGKSVYCVGEGDDCKKSA